ncbi:MAG: alpha/beta hydrolase [Sulfurimonadaceae bacterium]|nr:alpha/beta hydrolase [Sulfurimonadaceae bacterium]
MRYLILHGWGGSDMPHWQSHLASTLAANYGCVSFFPFSSPDMPKLDIWKKELVEHLQFFQPDVVICHSLANILWFHLCNDASLASLQPIKKLYLVAPPSLDCAIPELNSFFPLKAPKELYAQEILLITSTNDPYLSVEDANKLQKDLDVEMKMLENAGHINAESGFGTWEWMENHCQTLHKI